MKLKHVYQDEAGADGGTGGTGGSNADIQAQQAAAIEAATSGLKSKNSELLGKIKDMQDAFKKFDGVDPERYKQIMAKFDNDEEAALIAKGSIDEVVTRRMQKKAAELERLTGDAQKQREAAEARAKRFENQVLRGQLAGAAVDKDVGMHASAIKYAYLIAMQDGWVLDDDGEARLFDKAGNAVLGKDGKSPFSIKEWLSDAKTKEENPTWYLNGNTGGGNGGNNGTKTDDKTVKRSEFDTWNHKKRADFAKSGGKVVD